MSIIGKLKDLIFGAKPEPKFSESDFLAAKQRAETLVREFNESLVIAGQSKCRKIREERLQIARQWFDELKKLANKFPFLHLQNLQAVEARIIAVEAETRLLSYNDAADTSIKDIPDTVQPKRSGQDRQRLSEREEQTILLCIQSCFRVVNESIEIARKSKNLDTKISRLRVARDSLKEARRQASQFSLEVVGFVEAEAEINRIDEAIKAGTPTEIAGMAYIEINDTFASPARDLLKEATVLKKEKKFVQACSKLRDAYSAEGSENLMIEDRLRLPMYLQLAGQNDEGWVELNRLLAKYTDEFSQPRIEHQMKIFLRKEKNESASNPVRVVLRGDNKHMEDASTSNSNMINKMQNATSPAGKTVGDLQSEPMSAWGNEDIITGLKFSATMHLGKPLRVLLRHGEIHTDRTKPPPQIARNASEGMWMPQTNLSKFIVSTYASDVGPIHAEDYLPFLVAVQSIVETHEPIEQRIEKLQKMTILAGWQTYIDKHRGIDGIVQRFFPKFSNLGSGLDTPNRIAAASDETLLAIKGIGPAKLKALREHCACITEKRDADRFESESLVR